MIRIFPSKLTVDVEPIETHRVHPAGITIEAWLRETVPTYKPLDVPPISVSVNGFYIEPELWETVTIHDADDVVICPEPKYEALVAAGVWLASITWQTWAMVAFATISVGFSIYAMNAGGGGGAASNRQNDRAAGSKLNAANAKGNTARLNSVIREIAGRHRVYPDYLMPPHRYFTAGNPREQWIDMLLCIGVGEYDLDAADIKIGETQIASLGSDASYTVYGPGITLGSEPCAEWWQPCPEVGSSSGGQSGLEITSTYNVDATPEADTYTFSGNDISIPDGAGFFPDGWEADMLCRVEQYLPYMVVNASPRDIIGGDANTDAWIEQLEPTVGMEIEIDGEYNAGTYEIAAYTPYSAGVVGTPSTVEGASSPSRFDFGVTPLTFYVERGVYTWQVTLNATSSDVDGVLAEINAEFALRNAPFTATADSSDIITISEVSPYSGTAVTLSGDWEDVFGSVTTDTTGTATENDTHATITLNYTDGNPVANLEVGIVTMAVAPTNMLYKITGVTESSGGISVISVDRLDSTGAVMSWGGFYTRTMSNCSVELDASTTTGGWIGPFAACPEGEVTSELELDFFFPNGLMHLSKKGKPKHWRVDIEIEYRDIATAGAWTSLTKSYRYGTQDQLGFTESIVLSDTYRPEVRVRKTYGGASSTTTTASIVWYGLKAKLDPPEAYDDVTTIAVSVRGGNRLAAQSENLVNVEPTRKIPLLVDDSDGTYSWTANTATSDIVPWFCYVAKSVGYTDDDLDLPALVELDGVWQTRGDEYNASVDAAETLKSELMDCLQAGSAELTIKSGLLTPVRDQVRTTFEQMYSYQNMSKALSRQFTAFKPDDFDGIDVEYTNGTSWQKETVPCRALTDEGTRVEKIKVVGVTSRVQAWRLGMRRRMAQLLRRWKYDFETEMEGMNSNYLSYVALSEDLPGYSTSAQLTGYTEESSEYSVLQSSEPLVFTTGDDYVPHMIAVRKLDGTLDGPWLCTSVSANTVSIPDTLSFTPNFDGSVEYPHIIFGPAKTYQYPALVTTINPQNEGRCQVEAINYDAGVYAYDDAEPFENPIMIFSMGLGSGQFQLGSVRVDVTSPQTTNGGCTLTNDVLQYDNAAGTSPSHISLFPKEGYGNYQMQVTRNTVTRYDRTGTVNVFVGEIDLDAKVSAAAKSPMITPMIYDKRTGWYYGINLAAAPYYFYKCRVSTFPTAGDDAAVGLLGYTNSQYAGLIAFDDVSRMCVFRGDTEYLWYLSLDQLITRMNTAEAFSSNTDGRKTAVKSAINNFPAINHPICSLGRGGRLVVAELNGGVIYPHLFDLTSADGTLLDSLAPFAGQTGHTYINTTVQFGQCRWMGGGRLHPLIGYHATEGTMYLDVIYAGSNDVLVHTVKEKRIMPSLSAGGTAPLYGSKFIKF